MKKEELNAIIEMVRNGDYRPIDPYPFDSDKSEAYVSGWNAGVAEVLRIVELLPMKFPRAEESYPWDK